MERAEEERHQRTRRLPDPVSGSEYRDALRHIFSELANLSGLRIFWRTSGCSLRVVLPDWGPLSVGWIFPPGKPRWMGLTDLTLGWYEDSRGIDISEQRRAVLEDYLEKLSSFGGADRSQESSADGPLDPPRQQHSIELAEIAQTAIFQLLNS